MSLVRKRRSNSPFTEEQEIWIILEFGALRNVLQVQRNFRIHFKVHSRLVPNVKAFKRLVDRFINEGDTKPKVKTGGKQSTVDLDMVGTIKSFIDDRIKNNDQVSVKDISTSFDISMSKAWRIMRKHLNYKPYKPKTVAPLTEKHISDRMKFCSWLLEQPADFADRCVWSDEK